MTSFLHLLDRLGRRLVCLAVGHNWRITYDGGPAFYRCNSCEREERGVPA